MTADIAHAATPPSPEELEPVVTPDHGPRLHRLPIVHQLRSSVGLQRAMLVTGLVLTGLFVLGAIFAPLVAPYSWAQLRDGHGLFGAQLPPSSTHLLGTTVGGYDVLSRVVWGSRTALLTIVTAVVLSLFIGVFLGLVTQRPAELDPTILSQCSTLFAMRMSNDRDQALLRSAVSDSAGLPYFPTISSASRPMY